MRQLGSLPTESDAHRLAAWLVTQRIDAHAEQDKSGWSVWVRDEDHLPESRAALEHFRANPQDPRYQGVESAADRIRRDEDRERQKARSNVVEMRGRWGTSASAVARRCPLVMTLIGLSIVLSLATNSFSRNNSNDAILTKLLFVDPSQAMQAGGFDVWASIQRGQIWRLVTPIFIHYGMMHLVFNMFVLWDMGGQIENRVGSQWMFALVLVLAVMANLGEAFESSVAGGRGYDFGGMSGVGYGVFGYLLIRTRFGNREQYRLSPATTFMMLLWFVLCVARQFAGPTGLLSFIPSIANSAHTVGLFAGMAIAYAPELLRRSPD
jgi:GlpG protein